MDTLVIAIFLATLNNRLVECLIAPAFERFGWDRFWLLYLSAGTGLTITVLAGIRLLLPVGADVSYWADVIISGLIVGGGANLIHDIFNQAS